MKQSQGRNQNENKKTQKISKQYFKNSKNLKKSQKFSKNLKSML